MKRLHVLAALLGGLLLTGSPQVALAGGCGYSGYGYSAGYGGGYSGYSYSYGYAPSYFLNIPLYQVVLGVPVAAPGTVQIQSLVPVQAAPAAAAAKPAPVQAPAPAADDGKLKAILDRLDQLEKENKALKESLTARPAAPEAQGPRRTAEPDQAAAGQVAEALALLQASCGACHHESRSAAKGDGFSLFRGGAFTRDGDRDVLTGAQLLQVGDRGWSELLARIDPDAKSPMPPAKAAAQYPRLTAAQVAAVQALVRRVKS